MELYLNGIVVIKITILKLIEYCGNNVLIVTKQKNHKSPMGIEAKQKKHKSPMGIETKQKNYKSPIGTECL